MTEGPLCLRFVGTVTDEYTGEEQPCCWRVRIAEDETGAIEIRAHGIRTAHQLGRVRAVGLRTIHGRLFGGGPGGHLMRPSGVVNLDGTPYRRGIRERLRERWDNLESTAAD